MPFFVLRNGDPEPADATQWAAFVLAEDCLVQEDEVDGFRVETRFVGFTAQNNGAGADVFETWIHRGRHLRVAGGYPDLAAARKGHGEVVNGLANSAGKKENPANT
ncbi:MAG: hypothetical protein ACLFOY_10320 [Desulfatibacillaceae bacterium]